MTKETGFNMSWINTRPSGYIANGTVTDNRWNSRLSFATRQPHVAGGVEGEFSSAKPRKTSGFFKQIDYHENQLLCFRASSLQRTVYVPYLLIINRFGVISPRDVSITGIPALRAAAFLYSVDRERKACEPLRRLPVFKVSSAGFLFIIRIAEASSISFLIRTKKALKQDHCHCTLSLPRTTDFN